MPNMRRYTVQVRNTGRWVQSFIVRKDGRESVTLTKNRADAMRVSQDRAMRIALALDAYIDETWD